MKQFDNEYLQIVDNLRIMGDALVLLNPIKKIPTIENAIDTNIIVKNTTATVSDSN